MPAELERLRAENLALRDMLLQERDPWAEVRLLLCAQQADLAPALLDCSLHRCKSSRVHIMALLCCVHRQPCALSAGFRCRATCRGRALAWWTSR